MRKERIEREERDERVRERWRDTDTAVERKNRGWEKERMEEQSGTSVKWFGVCAEKAT